LTYKFITLWLLKAKNPIFRSGFYSK